MRFGIDVTGLYIAKAGIYYYTLNLVRHLLALDNDHRYVLLDYAPVRGDRPLPFDPRSLESDRSHWIEVKGPRQGKLINWKRLDFFGGRFMAQCVDRALDHPWQWLIALATRHRLNDALADLDVLHISDVNRFRSGKTTLISTVHDLSPILFPEFHTEQSKTRFGRQMRYLREQADVIIAISEHTKRDLVNILDVSEERIQVVYLAPGPNCRIIRDDDMIDQVVRRYGIPGQGYILHVGTLEPRKNLVRLVDAYAALLRCFGEGLPPLVLAGGKGWLYEGIFRRVEDLGLEPKVIFTGFVADEDLPFLFNGAKLFVYPSLYEGFGIPVLEAMACGVPVITSDVSSLPEVAGDASWLVDPTDSEALAAAMTTLLENVEQRTVLREEGLARAALFSWRRTARETLAIYEDAAR